MDIRRLFAVCALVLVGGILVACGSEDEEVSPTATIAPTEAAASEPTATTEVMEEEVTEEATAAADATPVASPMATPVEAEATPETGLLTDTEEDLEQTPQVEPIVPVPDDVAEVTGSTPVPMVAISGTLTLDGRAQQDFTLSEEGCVGLGEWRQLKPGAQVIVRDAAGTVVDIATLDAQDSDDECSWAFSIDAPGADFFSVSIPMVTEVWFDQNDPAVQSGELELFVP